MIEAVFKFGNNEKLCSIKTMKQPQNLIEIGSKDYFTTFSFFILS